jgi:hypothetical protein
VDVVGVQRWRSTVSEGLVSAMKRRRRLVAGKKKKKLPLVEGAARCSCSSGSHRPVPFHLGEH